MIQFRMTSPPIHLTNLCREGKGTKIKAAKEERLREATKVMRGLKKKRGRLVAKFRLIFVSTLHDTAAVLISDDYSDTPGSYPESGNSYTHSLSYNHPEADLLHILTFPHVLLWDPIQFLGNNYIAPVLLRSTGIYPATARVPT